MSTPQKILVRAPNWIGDQIMAYPFFYYLRQGYPNARITSVCMPWVDAVQFRNLVDDVKVLPKSESRSAWAQVRALEQGARMLRAHAPWDLGICLPNSFASAWLMARARVRLRRGYAADGRGWLLHDRLRWQPQAVRHRADAYVHLLPEPSRSPQTAQSFWEDASHGERGGESLDARTQFDARRAWPVELVLEPPASPYWVLAPGSLAASRRWPEERFAALARLIAGGTGAHGLVVGGRAEAALAARLCHDPALRLVNYTDKGPVAAYWQVFRHAMFTVSNDSGLAHVAALCGSPVYIVWGAGNPTKTRPLGPGQVNIMHHEVDCWPCERNVCRQPESRQIACLRGVDVETVWTKMRFDMLW